MFSTPRIISILISVVLVMLSAIPHEVAHGWMANRLGDPTAKRAGRLTLNPVAHIDPFGSIALPLIMGVAGGPVFAYAKPVPYNPMSFDPKTRRRDEALVALAGPVCNLLQALAGAGVWRLAYWGLISGLRSGALAASPWYDVAYWTLTVLSTYVYVNLMLMCFNLIPLPPLDGSKVISPLFRSERSRRAYYQVQRYAMPILIVALYLIPYALRVDPLGWVLDSTAGSLYDLLMGA